MTTPYLPDDCIYYILKYLQYCRSTLFNCLLVNRFWCKAAIPLLYADPFRLPVSVNHYLILSTLILCFNKTEILQLKNQLKLANINIININDKDKPLFEYLKYLENFDSLDFNPITFRWLNLPYRYDGQSNDFNPIFYQSILRQCDNIKQLGISLYSLNNTKNYNTQTNLTKLNTLRLGCNVTLKYYNEVSQKFLSNIVNNCLNLRKLEISLSSSVSAIKEKLCSIIQKQNNLKVFKLTLDCLNFLNDIFLSLEFQKYSLVHIELKSIDFCYTVPFKIVNLCNLKYLKFYFCKGLSLDQCEALKYSSFKLEGLYFMYNEWDHNVVTPLMIEYFGASLKELIILDGSLNIPIIENISIYCPDLITLEIIIKPNTDLLIFSYFKNLTIRILNIYDYWLCSYDSEILKMLADNLSTSIKEVSFRFHAHKTLKLKRFLENCHDYLEVINLNHYIELELLETILNYTERSKNNLRLLGVIESKEVLNDKELKVLNQIKAKGVKIVGFCSIYTRYQYEVI